jgi:hypothetical protein
MSNITIKGFVDITVFNEDGTVKEHQYKENTLTRAALASMFCDFLFRGDSSGGGSNSYDSYNDEYLAYLERSNNSNRLASGTSIRDRILQGTNGASPLTPIFSHRQPTRLGIYCLNTFIQNEDAMEQGQFKFDDRTQIAPYTKPDGITLSDYAVFYNTGTSESDFYPTNEITAQHFIRSLVDCSFNLPELSFTLSLRKTIGTGTVKSIVWGSVCPNSNNTAAAFTNQVFDVRARVLSQSNFNFAGYSPFYATEQRLVQTGDTVIPHTILWQDSARPNGTRYDGSSTREIFGFDLTVPGANDTSGNIGVEKFMVSSWSYMSRYMQGVIIGNDAFGLDHDTATGEVPSILFTLSSGDNGSVKVKVYKVANWKTSTTSTSIEIEFTKGGSGYTAIQDTDNRGITKPILVHNLRTGNLEVFFTPSYNNTSKRYRVGRAIINPVAFAIDGAVSYFESDFCISNYRLSMPGSDTTPTSANYPRARAVSGFADYNTTPIEYYLPYIAYRDPVANVQRALPGTIVQDPGQYLRLGVQGIVTSNNFVPIRLYLQGYPYSGRGTPNDSLGTEYSNFGTRGMYGVYRYTLWSYTLPISTSSEISGSAIQPPLQFIPLTGNSYTSGSFSMVVPSQVLCGLDLDTPVTKGASEVLLLKYGWKISQVIPQNNEL